MLGDGERKVLTVLWNTNRNEPSKLDIPYLSKRSQRSESQIKEAINILVKEGYVLWDKAANTFRVIYNRDEAKPVMWRGWSS